MTGDRAIACAIVVVLFCVYNANGREIPSFDSQPTKFAARELIVRGTLTLNHVVGAYPGLQQRHSFVLGADGRYRSAYSPVPSILAAALSWPAVAAGWFDPRSPNGPLLIACIGASILTACAVALGFLTARRYLSRPRALLLAAGLGAGTGLWSTVSQTLWQHETAILGLSLAVFALTASATSTRGALMAGVGMGLACTARLQVAPSVLVLMGALWVCRGRRAAVLAAIPLTAGVALLVAFNLSAFGHVLGAAPLLEAMHPKLHGTDRSFVMPWEGLAGLVFSPSRGLLIFSPVVAVAALAWRDVRSSGWSSPLRWSTLAAALQLIAYASYSVWWAGHTYGPRYALDLLPLLVVPAAVGFAHIRARSVTGVLSGCALAVSVFVAGLGAFVYPAEMWNTDPADVDTHHERLWDWSDTQIARALRSSLNERNFLLFRGQ